MAENKKFRPFGLRDKLSYAAGDFGCNMSFGLKTYLQIFYLDYIGIPAEVWAIIIILLQVWDAINDPIVGGLVDLSKPKKHHKYWNWIFWGGLLLLFSGALLFIPIPKSSPLWIKIVVACLGYMAWDMSYTMVNVPYGTMNSVITADAVERSQLSTWRSIGSIVGNMAVAIGLPFIIYDANDELQGQLLFPIALALGIIGFTMFMLFLKFTTIRVEDKPQEESTGMEKKKFNYGRAIKNFVTNRAIIGVTLAAFVQLIMTQGMTTATQILNASYFHSADKAGVLTIITFLPMIAVIPFIKPLVKKYGKQAVSTVPLLFGMAISVIMFFIEPSHDFAGMIVWNVLYMLVYASMCGNMMVCWALVSDGIDYNELKTGERDEGTTYAIYSFGRKIAQGVGASLIVVLLVAVGYNQDLSFATQTEVTVENVKRLVAIVYFVCLALQFVFLKFVYNLDKKKVDEMQIKLGRTSNDLIGQTGDDLEQ